MGVGSPGPAPQPAGIGDIRPKRTGDLRSILAGTSQNLVGLVVAAAAMLAAQVLIGRTLGPRGFGIVTVATQAAFVASFLTRAGMDMAVLRDVAVEAGAGRRERLRATVQRAVLSAALVSTIAALLIILSAEQIRSLFSLEDEAGAGVVEAAALTLPFLAVTNVWLGATRGLKIMRHTLYVFWAGQPVAWLVLMLAGWSLSTTPWMSVLAYSLSWAAAAAGAGFFWWRESKQWGRESLRAGDMSRLVRYAGPRAPAALLAQLLFWTDLFAVTNFVTGSQVGVYSAALRAGQLMVLFLTSVNMMFSPYVADLHARGETKRLDDLFKTLTRWTLAATLPAFLLLLVMPEQVLGLFGEGFEEGRVALLILIAGQFINVTTGSVGFVLIMAGRTGWDLLVYAGSFVLSLVLAFALSPAYGIVGAAIANALTFAVSNAVRLLLVKRFIRIQPYDRSYLRLVAPALVSLAVMWLMQTGTKGSEIFSLAITGLAGGSAYVLAYLVLGLTPTERRRVSNLVARIHPGAPSRE